VPAARERLLLTILRVAERSFQRGHMHGGDTSTHGLSESRASPRRPAGRPRHRRRPGGRPPNGSLMPFPAVDPWDCRGSEAALTRLKPPHQAPVRDDAAPRCFQTQA